MSTRIRALVLSLVLVTLSGSRHLMAQSFELLVTQTPPGTIDITNPANWGGVLEYNFAGTAPPAVAGPNNIPAASLQDPAGLAYSNSLGELFVGNRHGNTGSASVNRFFHAQSGPFTGNSSFSTAGLVGVHQIALSPVNGELFAATIAGGVSRFTSPGTTATPNGTAMNGTMRGVAVSQDGTRLYATTASNIIRQFDIPTNTELTSLVVSGASGLHFMRFRGTSELYAADFTANAIFRFSVTGNTIAPAGSFSSSNPIGLAFSPDLNEMFVSTHQNETVIHRYLFNSGNNTWNFTSNIAVGTSLGDIIVVPEPATVAVALIGMAGACVLRRGGVRRARTTRN